MPSITSETMISLSRPRILLKREMVDMTEFMNNSEESGVIRVSKGTRVFKMVWNNLFLDSRSDFPNTCKTYDLVKGIRA